MLVVLITFMLPKNYYVILVAKYLGHTKIDETLNTYSHMFSTALDNVVSIIDNLE